LLYHASAVRVAIEVSQCTLAPTPGMHSQIAINENISCKTVCKTVW
jgi:hypothetical protein